MIMETLVVRPQNEAQQKAVKAILEALQVPYDWEPEVDNESPYNPEFVAKILQGDEDIKAGRYTVIKTEDLWK